MRLSASQVGVLMRCPREWVYQYLEHKQQPPSKALEFGKAFHAILDGQDVDLTKLQAFDPDYPWAEALAVMAFSYHDAFPKELFMLAREMVYETDEIKAIADGIAVAEDGTWYIVENKTRTVSLEKIQSLGSDIQVALYHSLARSFADMALVDPALYAGIIYTATTKPAQRRSKKESREDFAARLTSTTEVVVIGPSGVRVDASRYLARAVDIAILAQEEYSVASKASDVLCNPQGCMRYNNACPYFDLCHGKNEDISFLIAKPEEKTTEVAE